MAIKNDLGEKITPKQFVQDYFLSGVASLETTAGVNPNLEGLSDREKGLISDQIARYATRLRKVLGVKPAVEEVK